MTEDISAKYRTQVATVWERIGVDRFGDPAVAAPRQIMVRWEERQTNFINDDGQDEALGSIIVLGERLKMGDWLALGTRTEASPIGLTNAAQIKLYQEALSPSGRYISRTAGLSFRRAL